MKLHADDLVLVHDYLIQMGGAERVVATMVKAFPGAPIYTSATDRAGLFPEFRDAEIHNTWLDRVPGAHRHFKKLFPLYPAAFASLRLPARRAVWISASTFAKCVRPPAGMTSFCYCHNPTRFLWDTDTYVNAEVRSGWVNRLLRVLLPVLRRVDRAAALRMDHLVANSENVRERIRRIYGRDATVIHPPVNVEAFAPTATHDGSYLIVARLIGYKNLDLAIRAFDGLDRNLRIIGEGTDRVRLESLAGRNVQFLGRVDEPTLRAELSRCRALIFPGEEDFGISPVEAQANGKPVIAFGRGGALETVIDGETGVFFGEPDLEALRAAIRRCESIPWDVHRIRDHAGQFSEAAFLAKMVSFMEARLGAPV